MTSMDMLFSALTVTSVSPPPTPTNNVERVHAEFRLSTLYNVGGGGGGVGEGDCKVFSKN